MQLEVRARDVLGNQSAPVAVSIRSDQSAPSINIAGVVDGQRSRDPVTPVIEVTDASPTSVTATLNGAPFASGTTVAEEGGYLLAVEAVDSVGWSSQANVAFTIDRTAPTLSVSHPVSGSTVLSGQLDVLGQTEPFARVELELGATTRAVVADASGAFAFASVQLGAGSNTLRLRALDDLDNASAWLTLDVVWAQALPPAREIPLLGPWALLFGALGFVLLAGTRMHAGRKRA